MFLIKIGAKNFIDEMSEMFNIEKEHLKEFEGVKEIIQIKVYQCECGEEYETHDIVRGKKLKKERKK